MNEKNRSDLIGKATGIGEVSLIASGDLRLSANQTCWPAQAEMEAELTQAFADEGTKVIRAQPVDEKEGHGFISSQRMGMDVFKTIPKDAPVVVAEAVWQYSHHVLGGLRAHRGPILTVANWSGQWPGLVGLLNLNGSLTKAGITYSTLWSENFEDDFFLEGLKQWLEQSTINHDTSHVRDLELSVFPEETVSLGQKLAHDLQEDMAILGVFDEGCMGMYNAVIDDELLNPLGIYKERLSQAALVAAIQKVEDQEAKAAYNWLLDRGMTFDFGSATEVRIGHTG